MRRAKRGSRAASRGKAQPAPAAPVPEDLNAASRALLEAEEMGRQPDLAAEGSVQGPLAGGPEVEAEQDQWLLERPGKGVEEAGD
jgi:hypothetical protein